MSDYFKYSFLYRLLPVIFLFVLASDILAQQFKRKGPNIGFQTGINYDLLFVKSGSGISYSAGITTKIFKVIYPSVNYNFYNDNITNSDSLSDKFKKNIKYSMLYFPVSLRVPFLWFSIGKTSGNRCTGIGIFAKAGIGYGHILTSAGNIITTIKNPFSFHAGLGFNVHRQGANWLNQFADIEYDIVYSRNFTKNISAENVSVFGSSTIGIVLRIVMFKTYKFGNM